MSSPSNFNSIVVNAVRTLQADEGTNIDEIVKYLRSKFDLRGSAVRDKLQRTVKRAVKDGILLRARK